MAVDDLPRPATSTINLGGIPTSQDTFRSPWQLSVVDKIERQKRHIAMALNLGIDHVVPWIGERGLHFFHCCHPHLHRVQPIDAFFCKRKNASMGWTRRSEEHTSELQSRRDLVCRLLLEKKKNKEISTTS